MKESIKLLSPKLDVVFQALFGEEGSERITKAFLEKILDTTIDTIDLNQNVILRRDKKDEKLGVLDVLAKINKNENVDIEMQIAENENILDRMVYYWSRLYVRSIKKKEDYTKLEKSIVILISNKKVKGLEELECHTEWKIYEDKYKKKILTDKFEIHIIELEKIKNNINSVSDGLLDWLAFLQNPKTERGIENMDSKDSTERMKNLEIIEEAREKLRKLSEDPQMQQLAWWREKGIYEENERISREKKIEEGEKRLEEGEKRLEEGKKELEDEKKEFAKRLKEGGISIEEIIKYTHLTKEEIEKL
ncbi:MAG: Rpn family recombination-promoting nuclease/putative transposase [Clostridia bacterium]|nr:Rpn family recombination-promoting nuclease/putative transposase [Clostridia bacterium]